MDPREKSHMPGCQFAKIAKMGVGREFWQFWQIGKRQGRCGKVVRAVGSGPQKVLATTSRMTATGNRWDVGKTLSHQPTLPLRFGT